jgi:hypothetical protein
MWLEKAMLLTATRVYIYETGNTCVE